MRSHCISVVLTACLAVAAGCDGLGYSNRVLWRVSSPDGQFVAVCQEIPALDGPGYDIRLEKRDGSQIRQLYQIGDGDPCSEVVWSADGRTLGILSSHVARVKFVDVSWALAHRDVRTAYWRDVDLSTEDARVEADGLQFIEATTVQVNICRVLPKNAPVTCEGQTRRFEIPLPIATGH